VRKSPPILRVIRAAVLLDGTDAPIERAHLLQERGRLAFRMGDNAGAVRWADEAIGFAEPYSTDLDTEIGLEAARAVAEALNTKGVARRCTIAYFLIGAQHRDCSERLLTGYCDKRKTAKRTNVKSVPAWPACQSLKLHERQIRSYPGSGRSPRCRYVASSEY
jgi:hypothetical protein